MTFEFERDIRDASTALLVELLTDHERWFAQGQPWATSDKSKREAAQIAQELSRRGVR